MDRDYWYEDFSAGAIPTQEDILDVNFRAIVSDLKSILSGNLVPISNERLSASWTKDYKERKRAINPAFNYETKKKSRMVKGRKDYIQKKKDEKYARLIAGVEDLVLELVRLGLRDK